MYTFFSDKGFSSFYCTLSNIDNYNPDKGSLSTYIYNYARWEIGRYLYKRKHSNKPLPIHDNVMVATIDENIWEYIPESLSNDESAVIKLKLQRHTYVDIGKKLGYSRGWANNVFKRAVNKINESN